MTADYISLPFVVGTSLLLIMESPEFHWSSRDWLLTIEKVSQFGKLSACGFVGTSTVRLPLLSGSCRLLWISQLELKGPSSYVRTLVSCRVDWREV